MSILLHRSRSVEKLEIITKHAEPKTSSILLISVAIFFSVVLLMYVGILFTDSSMKAYSTCREKIVGYEERGLYTGAEQFKLALSYCAPT
jgi:predicted RNA-binding protein